MGRAHEFNKLIAEKCVVDASEYIWLRLEARSVLIGKSQCGNWIVFRDKSDILLDVCDSVVISEGFNG